MRPVIGISGYEEEASWGAWTLPAALVPWSYIRSIDEAGGLAIVIPPTESGALELLEKLDGLVLTGGSDIDPSVYHADSHDETIGVRPTRDRAELSLLTAALERDMPVLGICRGLQVVNVARGGDLVQHLPDEVGHERHRQTLGVFSEHEVSVAGGSRLVEILGGRVRVKSHHHQGPGRIGDGLQEVAWAEDGTVEGLEDPNCSFLVSVLWHPEEDENKALFEALVEAASAYADARAFEDRRAVS